MRTAAAILTAAACTLYGTFLRGRLAKRAEVLRMYHAFLLETRARILCLREPLPRLLASCAEAYPALTFLADCTARCEAGDALPMAWETAIRDFLRSCPLSEQEETLLTAFPACAAYGDAGQIGERLCGLAETAALYVGRAEEKSVVHGKLYMRVCGAVGLLLGILIV